MDPRKPVKVYSVGEGSRAAEPMLCVDDASELERFLAPQAATEAPAKKAAAKRPATKKATAKKSTRADPRRRIMTLAEIEESKKK
jgi:hypothetical protein